MGNVRTSDQLFTWSGHVAALYIARTAGAPMETLVEARLIADRGIVGDRYYNHAGTHSDDEDRQSYQLTLIEQETIEAIRQERKMKLDASAPRRNIVTRGCALNHLVHRTFRIGEVLLRGVALCEPCPELAETASHLLMVSLLHRGGLGAQVLRGGVIRVGDVIEDARLEELTVASQER